MSSVCRGRGVDDARARPPGSSRLSGLCQITEELYLSSGRAARDASALARSRITCVINVSERGADPRTPGVEYVHLPAADSPLAPLSDRFDRVADAIRSVGAAGGRTLVHCRAGVSRSACLCMAYLVKHRGATLRGAHAWVRAARPVARPNVGFWKQLIRYEEELRGRASVRMVSSGMGEIPDVYEEESRNMLPL